MGFAELLVILLVVLLFFGAGRLPAVGGGLGKAIRGFRDAMRPDAPAPPAPPPAPPPARRELPPGDGAAR